MADNWANWYSGNMAPPNRLPNGSYVPAPSVSQPMTVQQMYQGIYGTPEPGTELTTRSIRTVPIDPYTGQPIATAPTLTPTGGDNSALGAIANATGAMTAAPVYQPSGSMNSYKSQDQLPQGPAVVGRLPAPGEGLTSAQRAAMTSLSAPARQTAARPIMFPLQGGGRLTGSGSPTYGNYTGSMRMANPSPLMPGPASTPQVVSGDPWGGMRMPGQGTAPMAGYGNAPGAAQPAQQQARGLFETIFGSGGNGGLMNGLSMFGGGGAGLINGLAKMAIDAGMGTGGLMGTPTSPMSAAQVDALRQSRDYAPGQIAALQQNRPMYSASPGSFMPTMAPRGKARKTYGDGGPSSPTGSGGSLVGR